MAEIQPSMAVETSRSAKSYIIGSSHSEMHFFGMALNTRNTICELPAAPRALCDRWVGDPGVRCASPQALRWRPLRGLLRSAHKSSATILFLLIAPYVAAQSSAGEKTFAKDGLSFNYPEGWTLTDKSTPAAQHLILSKTNTTALIMIVAYRDLISNTEQFPVLIKSVTIPYVDNISKNFVAPGHSVQRDNPCIEIANAKVSGFRIRGSSRNEPSTGEVFGFSKARRFTNLMYIRADKDEPQASVAWNLLLKTINITNQQSADDAEIFTDMVVTGGVLNGRATSLPQPVYPAGARASHVTGSVAVEVSIDETGKVVSAVALTGHPLLKKAAIDAALHAKFSPTKICEQAVKVNGTIIYNFF
jgi:TonB family protein